MKRILACSLAIAMLAAAPASQARRAMGYEVWYVDDYGNIVGTYTVECFGPPVMEGIKTDHVVLGYEWSCA